ncbi:hypothetical protein HYU11_06470 [Candidatus Woesearchaeota archaeon]|nr:hypothetical protein [Candidatus Woesearchaeota archaeon]
MSIYTKLAVEQIPRLLTALDRNPSSSTFGCFDRNYWHYKTSDFPCMRLQEASLTLALATKANTGIKKELLMKWAEAATKSWSANLSQDGSASEWYPNEKSYVATAFSTYAVSETAFLLGLKNDGITEGLRKSTKWLIQRTEHRVQNQQSGAIAAILTANKILKDEQIQKNAYKLIKDLASRQSPEGWFSEYGGPDIGYLSLTVDYLAKASRLTEEKDAENAAIKASEFISNFLHPNYTIGGTYGSRNTEYLIPHGFEILKNKSGKCRRITGFLKEALRTSAIAGPYSMDDRYLAYNLYTYLQAGFEDDMKTETETPSLENKSFPLCQIYIRAKKSYQIIINCMKGGSFTIFNGHQKTDSGLRFKTGNATYSTGFLNKDVKITREEGEVESFTIEGQCIQASPNTMTTAKHIGLRAFQLTAGRYISIKEKLRDKLITPERKSGFLFQRKIVLGEKATVTDRIWPAEEVKELFIETKTSEQYIPSSKFYNSSDNQDYRHEFPKQSKEITITRTFGNEGA